MSMLLARCKSCGAEVVWLKSSAKGKLAPIDPAPAGKSGNIVVDEENETYLTLTKWERERTPGNALHTSHFATCPNAAQHRRKTGKPQ